MIYRLPHSLQQPLSRWWYSAISRLDRDADMTFMNYGWADLDHGAPALALPPEDERNRYCIQLYHRVAGAVELRGRDVLEVGCGRGGGAAYIARALQPRTTTGLDYTRQSIEFCRRHHAAPGLSFVQGDAEALQFPAGSFDAVVNVESSHCYGSMAKFLGGVRRVLRPGGHFLYADHRDRANLATWRRQLADSGLNVLDEDPINANVVRALELDDARKRALIDRRVPEMLRPMFYEFAAMQGTRSLYGTLRDGTKTYMRFVLQKG
jgi:SAM-dependent methyltransferase